MLSQKCDLSIGFLTKLYVALSVIFVFCNYYYLYFFDFNQGVSASPGYYSILKLIGVGLFSVAIFEPEIKRSVSVRHFVFTVFFVFSSAVFFVKRFFFDAGDDLYFNIIICAIPFVLFRINNNFDVILFFFEVCLWVLVFQILIDIYFFINELSLWENGAFIGGLGNPSSFGIFCNIVLAYVLFLRKFSVFSVFSIIVIIIGIVGTQSLFSMLAFIFLSSYFFWCKSKFLWLFLCAVSSVILVILWPWVAAGHLGYKISSLFLLLFGGGIEGEGSKSITLRFEIHNTFLQKVSEEFLSVMIFGYNDFYYYNTDSQFLTFFGSFGVLPSLLFFGIAFCQLFLVSQKYNVSRFFWISIFLFFVMFFTNRVIDYYPMALVFFLLVLFDPKIIRCNRI